MNWKLVSVSLVTIGSFLWVFWPENRPAEDPEISERVKESRKISKRDLSRRTIVWKPRQEEVDFYEKHGVPILTPEQLDQYLADQDYSAGAFVAAYYVSKEAQFLREGLERHPESGFLLFTTLSIFSGDSGWSAKELLEWSQRFLEVELDNFFAHVLMASQLDFGEFPDEVMEHLGSAFLLTTLRDYTSERQAAIRQMYENMGSTPEQASAAILGPKLIFASRVNHRLVSLGKELRGELSDLDPETSKNVRLAIHSLGEALLNSTQPQTVVSEVFAMRLKKYSLHDLPPEGPSFEEGMTVAQVEEAREERLDEIERWIESGFDVNAASTEVLNEYLNRVRENGEMSAIQWLQGQAPLKKDPDDRE